MPISLLHGPLPVVVQTLAAVLLVAAIGWRTRRWRRKLLPLAVLLGVAVAAWARWLIAYDGLADDPAPGWLWLWIALTGLAAGVLVVGWRSARLWRRTTSALAIPLCLLSAALVLNMWVGYVPTVQAGWGQLTAGPLPDQTDQAGITALVAHTQQVHTLPTNGRLLPVTIPSDASGFKHRNELVYLPPAWFASNPPPRLPTVMMIGGDINTPADWVRAGNAVETVDAFAAQHGGNAPVLVFVDSIGNFANDTECVNGVRGNPADHLTKDVVPYTISTFGVSPEPSNWGVVGWSMGGTCAVDLATMHPELFSVFEDISGDLAPNTGTRDQTIDRLFGGNASAWADFDPVTVMIRHGRYANESGWFASPTSTYGQATQADAARALCDVGRTVGINCAVVPMPGKHDWPFATAAFASALPWLAFAVHTPGAPPVPLGTTPSPTRMPNTSSTPGAGTGPSRS
ncbi:alpha/beta hydrolase [Mycolicibacterium mengxianglii]|uniref:alpha/beta hydrolase n=1 Tax=Mycolicibacterium mengxianglii TaxID=2736649 RepID=UPI0018D1ED67|nr:alpha/beta hydrolase-fold protein [Mycolicibacterium mengxianglii]